MTYWSPPTTEEKFWMAVAIFIGSLGCIKLCEIIIEFIGHLAWVN